MCRDLIVQGLTPCKSAGIIASTDNFVRYVYRRSQDGLTGRKSLQINIGEEAAFITAQPLLLVCIRRPIASITAWCATVHASTQPQNQSLQPEPSAAVERDCQDEMEDAGRRADSRAEGASIPTLNGRRRGRQARRATSPMPNRKANTAYLMSKHGVFEMQIRRV